MAFPASILSTSSSTPKYSINLFKEKTFRPQFQRCFLPRVPEQSFPSKCMKVVSMAQFGEPNNKSKLRLQISVVKEKLWEAIPVPVKGLPWKKAANTMLERLLFLGQKAFIWSLIAFCVLSFLSDIIYSISRNRELVIPFGLFAGCFVTDILREALQQVLPSSDGNGFEKHFLAISCFFVAVKFVSAGLPIQARMFLLHVANGGFMQVLWLWRGRLNKRDEVDGVDSRNPDDASLAMDVES